MVAGTRSITANTAGIGHMTLGESARGSSGLSNRASGPVGIAQARYLRSGALGNVVTLTGTCSAGAVTAADTGR